MKIPTKLSEASHEKRKGDMTIDPREIKRILRHFYEQYSKLVSLEEMKKFLEI